MTNQPTDLMKMPDDILIAWSGGSLSTMQVFTKIYDERLKSRSQKYIRADKAIQQQISNELQSRIDLIEIDTYPADTLFIPVHKITLKMLIENVLKPAFATPHNKPASAEVDDFLISPSSAGRPTYKELFEHYVDKCAELTIKLKEKEAQNASEYYEELTADNLHLLGELRTGTQLAAYLIHQYVDKPIIIVEKKS